MLWGNIIYCWFILQSSLSFLQSSEGTGVEVDKLEKRCWFPIFKPPYSAYFCQWCQSRKHGKRKTSFEVPILCVLTISLPHPHTSPTHSGPSPQKYLSYFSSSWLRSTLPLPAGPFLNYTRKCLWKGRIKGDWLRSLTRAPAEPSKVRLPPAPLCRKWGWEFRRRARSGGLGAGAGNPWGFSERSVLSPGGRELSPPSQDPLQKRLPPRHAGTTRPSSGPQPCLSGDSRSPHPHQPAHRHVSPSPRPPPTTS